MTRFFVLFSLIIVILFAAELTPWAQRVFVVPFTSAIAAVSAQLIQLWDPQVATHGKVIWDSVNGFASSSSIH